MEILFQDNEIITEYYVNQVQLASKPLYTFGKRLFDLIVSAIGLVLLFVPLVVLAVMICVESKGPAIFKQERLGKDGKPFTLYKLRSMYLNAEQNGPQWTEENDYRCTKVGRFIRNYRLDEIPQLYNVFKGEMSIIGPRPERAYFYEKFEEYIHGFSNRLAVLPGITGWAQVNGGYTLKPEEKIVYDMEYIQKRSIAMDIRCLIKTVQVVFSREGAR